MIADSTECGYPRFYHRKKDRYSYLGYRTPDTLSGLAIDFIPAYTAYAKSKSFRVAARATPGVLEPLKENKPVTLLMDAPARRPTPKMAKPAKPIPVVLVPGNLIGTSSDRILIAVIGRGSAVVQVSQGKQVANLVLAGVPQRLAHALMDELRRTMKGN